MKIAFLIRSLDVGGAERQLVILAKGLHNRGHEIIVMVLYKNGKLEKELNDAGVPIHMLSKRGRWDIFGFFIRLARFLSQEKPDVIHGYLVVPNILTVFLKPFFPRVHIVWGIRASYMDLSRYDWLSRLLYLTEQKLSRFADLIIVNSRAGFEYALKNGFPDIKMIIIPNGIDTGLFRPDIEARKRVRASWGVRDAQKLIGLVGRLDPMKDHPTFIKAAALLAAEREDICFVCVGDGPVEYLEELIAMGKALGLNDRLTWAGEMHDMPGVYNAIDIYTSTSYGEGFPNVIGEAMACNVPCVVTDVGDSSLIVGDTGVIIPPHNPESLVAGWITMLNRINKDNYAKCYQPRERIINQFSLNALFSKTTKALSDLLLSSQ